jgi:hypothetical protein
MAIGINPIEVEYPAGIETDAVACLLLRLLSAMGDVVDLILQRAPFFTYHGRVLRQSGWPAGRPQLQFCQETKSPVHAKLYVSL